MNLYRLNLRLASAYSLDDLKDGIEYVSLFLDDQLSVDELKFTGVRLMDPCDFYYDGSHLSNMGRLESGWLREVNRDEWLNELRSEYDRDFSHIVSAYESGNLKPGILINGEFADGKGRSQFCYALGIDVKVASFSSKT